MPCSKHCFYWISVLSNLTKSKGFHFIELEWCLSRNEMMKIAIIPAMYKAITQKWVRVWYLYSLNRQKSALLCLYYSSSLHFYSIYIMLYFMFFELLLVSLVTWSSVHCVDRLVRRKVLFHKGCVSWFCSLSDWKNKKQKTAKHEKRNRRLFFV